MPSPFRRWKNQRKDVTKKTAPNQKRLRADDF
jgi:hypothetical protein